MARDADRGAPVGPGEVVERMVEAHNAGDLDGAMGFLAADAVNHGPPPTADIAAWRRTWVDARARFPDLQARIEQTVVEGDTVCHRYVLTGTDSGGDAPTGRRFEVIGLDMVRVRDGKVVEHWALMDAVGMAAQLAAADE